ncbi:MAG: aspartyl protease family protein [Bacteroidota bacterium]
MKKYKINIIIEELEKENYHLFVELKIGENKARLLLDTGASKTVFDKERVLAFVSKKKIKKHDSKSVGLGATEVKTKVVKLKKLKIGGMKIEKMEVAVLDIGHVNQTYKQINLPEIDGVLGSDFLMKYLAKIDYEKSVLGMKG